jgi:recombinational DNA repair protein RecR
MPFSIFGSGGSERSKRITINKDEIFEKYLQERIIAVADKIVENSSTYKYLLSELVQIRYDITKRIAGNPILSNR